MDCQDLLQGNDVSFRRQDLRENSERDLDFIGVHR